MSRLINPFEQFFDSAGDPLVSGKLYFYTSGSSSALKTTYADSAQTIPNANPVILNGDGRCPNVFGNGTYRVILTSADDVQIIQRDPVGGELDNVFGADWESTQVYDVDDVVREDNQYWISVSASNQGNQPSLDDGSNWELWPDAFGSAWSANKIYSIGNVVYEDSQYWISLTDSNQNNQPSTDGGTNWELWITGQLIDEQIFTASGTWNKPDGIQYAEVTVIGAGGGGGGVDGGGASTYAGSAGGGGGGHSYKRIPEASLGATETVTIGAGGAGGTGAAAGSTGGTSSFGSHCEATGGTGGSSMAGTGNNQAAAGGTGGTGANGDINTNGGNGQTGIGGDATSAVIGGGGGDSFYGGGADATSNSGNGNAGNNYGGGGGGGISVNTATDRTGGAGSDGLIRVRSYN